MKRYYILHYFDPANVGSFLLVSLLGLILVLALVLLIAKLQIQRQLKEETEEKAKKVQNIATALAAIFGAVGAFFGIFQAQMSANLKNQVTSLQNASQQTIVNVISTLGDDAQAADLAQSGDTVAITEQLINVYNSRSKRRAHF